MPARPGLPSRARPPPPSAWRSSTSAAPSSAKPATELAVARSAPASTRARTGASNRVASAVATSSRVTASRPCPAGRAGRDRAPVATRRPPRRALPLPPRAVGCLARRAAAALSASASSCWARSRARSRSAPGPPRTSRSHRRAGRRRPRPRCARASRPSPPAAHAASELREPPQLGSELGRALRPLLGARGERRRRSARRSLAARVVSCSSGSRELPRAPERDRVGDPASGARRPRTPPRPRARRRPPRPRRGRCTCACASSSSASSASARRRASISSSTASAVSPANQSSPRAGSKPKPSIVTDAVERVEQVVERDDGQRADRARCGSRPARTVRLPRPSSRARRGARSAAAPSPARIADARVPERGGDGALVTGLDLERGQGEATHRAAASARAAGATPSRSASERSSAATPLAGARERARRGRPARWQQRARRRPPRSAICSSSRVTGLPPSGRDRPRECSAGECRRERAGASCPRPSRSLTRAERATPTRCDVPAGRRRPRRALDGCALGADRLEPLLRAARLDAVRRRRRVRARSGRAPRPDRSRPPRRARGGRRSRRRPRARAAPDRFASQAPLSAPVVLGREAASRAR